MQAVNHVSHAPVVKAGDEAEAEEDAFDPDDLSNFVFEDRTGLPSARDLPAGADTDEEAAAAAARQASSAQAGPSGRRKAVWEDPDDAAAKINVAGRSRLRKLRIDEAEAVLSGKPSALIFVHSRPHKLQSEASRRPLPHALSISNETQYFPD